MEDNKAENQETDFHCMAAQTVQSLVTVHLVRIDELEKKLALSMVANALLAFALVLYLLGIF